MAVAGKALIVLAHPAERSLSHLFAQTAHDALEANGAQTRIIDLYGEGFNPALSKSEREAYYTKSQALDVLTAYADVLIHADTLVLVFPTWWFGLPAILKGWLDRAFAPGVAFDHATDFGPIKPRLTNLKRVVVITTLGSPAWIDWLVMRRPVRRVLKTAVFGLCAPQAKFQMQSLYNAEKLQTDMFSAFQSQIVAALK